MGLILIVDDETSVVSSFRRLLVGQGHEVLTASTGEEAIGLLEKADPDLMIMDIQLPGQNGLQTFQRVQAARPRLPVIIMTAYGTTDSAIQATKLGAFDYHLKPFDPAEILRAIDKALQCVRLLRRQVEIDPSSVPNSHDALVGQSPGMQAVYKLIGRVALTDATVLIRGETGTGKELVARAIYQHSLRRQAPLQVVNCVAIPETLLESELFGYEKGAFTGAAARRIGKFEQANGATLFLDEIGDMPLATQAKILRVLQERSFERLGGNETITADVRVIAATNRNLETAIREGKFRDDLYHRLDVVSIHLPPLRDRPEDIPRLALYFLERSARQLRVQRPVLSDEAMEILVSHPWPGNVRELEHCVHRALILTLGYPIQTDDIRRAIERPGTEPVLPTLAPRGPDLPDVQASQAERPVSERKAESQGPDIPDVQAAVRYYLGSHPGKDAHLRFMAAIDRLLVSEALRITHGNQTHAARLLGLTRPTLQAKMKKHHLLPGEWH
ncbi:MAG: sigma-54-dependent Fis family transcriptional regulator [Planctomycetes bacterium]|nr:sigma-54-dependent Fis family transcriptional regulator [Planctomycetota bacterium]